MTNVVDTLQERGFIEAMTAENLNKVTETPLTVYCGFDPTSDSLHLGNLIPIMGLAWFQRFGHQPIALIGGATALVGDPSGKKKERPLLDIVTIEKNVKGIRKNFEAVLDFKDPVVKPLVLNNIDWYRSFSFIEFLRDVGKQFRLGPMLSKESVRARLESEEGMSFTEFSYQLLQGYDFYHLFEKHRAVLQLGGSDQWGNITAGIDLIRKELSEQSYGLTFPLLTTSSGQKFGKTEKGAVYLSPDKCSPYEFYQYLFRSPDADVIRLMKMLTFMDISEIREWEKKMLQSDYEANSAQRKLAQEVTKIVHGEKGVEEAERATQALKPGSETSLNVSVLEAIAKDMPNCFLSSEDVVNSKLFEVLVRVGLQSSKGEARRLIKNGGAYINNTKIIDAEYMISQQDLIDNRLILLAAGKKNKMIVRVH